MPGSERMTRGEVFRLRLVRLAQRAYPNACWADLVGWALGEDRSLLETLRTDARKSRLCGPDCYCGKYSTRQPSEPLDLAEMF